MGLLKYQDDATQESAPQLYAYKEAWNEVQKELKCCGVDNVNDWEETQGSQFNFPAGIDKPLGCCEVEQDGDADIPAGDQQDTCRRSKEGPDSTKYYFEGCFTKIKSKIEDNQNTVVGVAIGVGCHVPEYAILLRHVHHGQISWGTERKERK